MSLNRHSLDALLKLKRNKPKAVRFLKVGNFAALFKTNCPGMIKYQPSRRIASAVARHVMRKIRKRMKAEDLVNLIYIALSRLPLNIGVSFPGKGTLYNCKGEWHHIGICDEHILNELQQMLQNESYTSGIAEKEPWTVLVVKTY